MIVNVNVISFFEEALDVDETNDLFGVGREGVLCADDEDVGEKS